MAIEAPNNPVDVEDWVLEDIHAPDASITLEDYMEKYAAHHYEWVEGILIEMSPVSGKHDDITYYLRQLLSAYLEFRPIGVIRSDPFVLRLPKFPKRRREPDLMVILEANRENLKDTFMDGPADICIEVVSQESTKRDYGEKLEEYEAGGVPEYWIIDPIRKNALFFQRDAEAERYSRVEINADGNYSTPALPDLKLHVATLWGETLPGPAATVQAIQQMLSQ